MKNESSGNKSSGLRAFLAGSASAICSTIILQPFDLIKTRLQSPITVGYTTPGLMHLVIEVMRKEKLVGFWQGLLPSLYRTVPAVGLYFSSLHVLSSQLGRGVGGPVPAAQAFLLGLSARCFSDICILPLTVIKARYESGHFRYSSVTQAASVIYRTEGFRGLFSGLTATLLRDAPYSGIYLTLYTNLKQRTSETWPAMQGKPWAHFACGMAAGSVASFVTQPADVVKTHMQLYPNKYASFTATLSHIYKADGVMGFQRGLLPRLLRRTLMSALTWTVFELANK